MKENINYYYNFDIDNIIDKGDVIYFKYNNNKYCFLYLKRNKADLDVLDNIINELNTKGIFCHRIIRNTTNELYTIINNKIYVLLELINSEKNITLNDMIDFTSKTIILNENYFIDNWTKLWESKIDYIENQIIEINMCNIIYYSVDYYIGLAENAIKYYNKIKTSITEETKISLSHKRIISPNRGLTFYNPLSFIFDFTVRDYAEYLKSLFYNDKDAYEELKYYLKIVKLDNISYHLLFIRLLFPTYYFDVYEDVINNSRDEKDLLKIISKAEEYEMFLKKAYKEISLYAQLEKIDWIKFQR